MRKWEREEIFCISLQKQDAFMKSFEDKIQARPFVK